MAVTYIYLWIAVGPSIRLVLSAVHSAVLGLVLVTDLEGSRIPNIVILPAIAFAAAAAFCTPGLEPWRSLGGGTVGFAVFLVLALFGRALYGPQALGAGEVKLATFAGLVTGLPLVFVVIGATILAAGATSLAIVLARVRGRRDTLPYAPFLVAGVTVAALWGRAILQGFLR
jgi:prepilin signal peptidase PulO-like enzyme (type II secretory pathway)